MTPAEIESAASILSRRLMAAERAAGCNLGDRNEAMALWGLLEWFAGDYTANLPSRHEFEFLREQDRALAAALISAALLEKKIDVAGRVRAIFQKLTEDF